MKIFFCHVLNYFGLVFDGKSILNEFQVPQGHVGHPHGLGGVHQVLFFFACGMDHSIFLTIVP